MRNFSRLLWILLLLGALFLSARMAVNGAVLPAVLFAAGSILVVRVYSSPRTLASRYLLPGLAAFAAFVLLPLLYTVYIAFTNFGGGHLLSRARVEAWFDTETCAPSPDRYPFRLHRLPPAPGDPASAAPRLVAALTLPRTPDSPTPRYLLSPPFDPDALSPDVPLRLSLDTVPPTVSPLTIRDVVALRPALRNARFLAPGQPVPLRVVNLREIAPRAPLWPHPSDDPSARVNALTGQRIVPDPALGNYVDAATSLPVGPGWRVFTGFANYRYLFGNPAVRSPFLRIFAWNIVFAFLSVASTFALGLLLASLLQWPQLRHRALYRTLLLLPYAIPAFIPILVFKGLFNESFGEINLILTSLFGVAPRWFTNPALARLMILLVNLWLGYPYMLLISAAMLQTVPPDLYEAAAIDGAGPFSNFFRITLPQVFPPLFPLLVASFAFNFNNFSLVYLLTGGKPDLLGSATVAGSTDLLVSYTFRMAFKDSASRFGFAAAVATILFLLVAVLAWLQLRRPATSPASARAARAR